MAEKRRDSIADDWLEVESAASVLSLPDDDEHDLYHHSQPTSPLLPAQAHHSPGSYTPQIELAVEKPTSESSRQPSERSPTPHNEATEATEAKPSASIEETSTDDDTFSASPIDCHKSCCTAITSLDDVAKLARELAGPRVSTLSHLQSTCKGILTQAKDLETMLGAYAKHWVAQGSNVDTDEMPLSASVWDWISNLRDELLRAQGEMQHLKPPGKSADSTDSNLPPPLEAKDIPLSTNMALASCLEKLEDMQNTLADFLPIFKVDFDEFRTKWMSFPVKETEKELPPPQSPRSSRRQPPHPAVCRIRRALYDLKDHIQMIVVFLSKLCHSHQTPGLIDPTVTRSLVDLSEAITTILTNHGSEWIESDTRSTPQGLISYTQFLELDPDVLHDINGHLDNFKEELDIEKSERVASLYTPEMIHNHQVFLLLEGGQLNELRGVIEFLWSMLIKDTQNDGNWI